MNHNFVCPNCDYGTNDGDEWENPRIRIAGSAILFLHDEEVGFENEDDENVYHIVPTAVLDCPSCGHIAAFFKFIPFDHPAHSEWESRHLWAAVRKINQVVSKNEGWVLFHNARRTAAELVLDEGAKYRFGSTNAAMAHIIAMASFGSQLHRTALELMQKELPDVNR